MTTDLNGLRRRILEVGYASGEPQHYASALSILEIVWTLYDRVMGVPLVKIDQGDPQWAPLDAQNWQHRNADQFVLSKAHGCMALYAVLEAKGILPPGEFDKMGKRGAMLGGHPAPGVLGVTFACGSLGHGLPAAVGLAYAKHCKGEPGVVFVLVGDGEMQEGSCQEAVRLARELSLENLRVIVDQNHSHNTLWFGYETGATDAPSDLSGIREDHRALIHVVATVKGHGIAAMERAPAIWHRRHPTPEEYRHMMEALA